MGERQTGGCFPIAYCQPIAAPRLAKVWVKPRTSVLNAVQANACFQPVSRCSGLFGGSSFITLRHPAFIDRSTTELAIIAAPAPTRSHVICSLAFGLGFRRGFFIRDYLCAYTVVLPARSKVRMSYFSLIAPSMPGDPVGMPGTARPAIAGFSFSMR